MSLSLKMPVSTLRSTRSSFRGQAPVALTRSSGRKTGMISSRKATQIKAFQVTFQTPDGDVSMECDGDTYMLDAADEAELDMPYSCRAGSCSTCLGKIVSGEVDQSEGTFLDEDQQKEGWVLTCISYPKGDVTIASHKEGEV